MDFLAFLVLSLAVSPVLLLPPPREIDVDRGGKKSIFEINKDLNLQGGDIMRDNTKIDKSTILGDQYRWNGYIPYVLNETLSVNDKGIILRAFEQMRLRVCIDFKPWTAEEDYISVERLSGCWSDIGKRGGMQKVSIGVGCASVGTVEHEFLHALGFFHEQSRYDRDDYVTIIFENILADNAYNFDKASKLESTTQGTPYDYTSVMHYGQNDFTNGNGHTIITKVPQFQDLIGQSYGLSPMDAIELNMLYKCGKSVSFLDHCSFDGNMCDMSTCSSADNIWEMTYGGPFSDHSRLESIGPALSMDTTSPELSFFMHFSTMTGQEGNSGRLESRVMTPSRDCRTQCLQFFYYHSGHETDQLNIWIREYENNFDTVGTLRLMDQITGPPADHWQLHHVPLNADKPFIVEFEGRKGAGDSNGGFSVDDINLSESECPQNVWQIRNFMELWNTSAPDTNIYSPMYYSPEGYRYQVYLKLSQQSLAVYVRLVSGIHDDYLQWPCSWKQVTFSMLDQDPNMQLRMSLEDSMTMDPSEMFEGKYVWGKPSEVGSPLVTADNETVYVSMSWGLGTFVEKARLSDREFVKGGDIIFLVSMQDVSALQQSNSLPCPHVPAKDLYVSPYPGAQEGSCTPRVCLDIFCSGANIIHSSVALLLALVLLVINQ